jgi:AraC-like DNA-binding protein
VFKLHKKVTFIDYLTDFRIGRRRTAPNPKSNVKEVCYAVGYSDPNYFARVFKRIVGLTRRVPRSNFLGRGTGNPSETEEFSPAKDKILKKMTKLYCCAGETGFTVNNQV